jgi:hypothetical protein
VKYVAGKAATAFARAIERTFYTLARSIFGHTGGYDGPWLVALDHRDSAPDHSAGLVVRRFELIDGEQS